MRTLSLVSWLLVVAASAAAPQVRDPGLARLEQEVARLAPLAGGTVGVAAVHLESGREVYFNRVEPFPMASTYKVAIAVQLLTRVGQGAVGLDSLTALSRAALHRGCG